MIAIALGGLVLPAAASADLTGGLLGGFRLSASSYTVHERDGQAVITVTRQDTLLPAQVRYGDSHLTAIPNVDYTPTGGRLDFDFGQSTATFSIPIVDHGISGPPRTLSVYLYGASPIGLEDPNTAVLTIVNDDANPVARVASNPLGLTTPPAPGNPLAGARLYVDHTWGMVATQARQNPAFAGELSVIADQPQTQRFGAWDGPDPSIDVSRFLERAYSEEPGTVPFISTYRVVGDHCVADTPAQAAAYRSWIDGFASGISSFPAIVFLEMDALITSPCLHGAGLQRRLDELNYAATRLSQLPRTVVYMDAGAADALPARVAANLLNRAGVSKIQGFFLNSTHFDWTSNEIRYGEQISRMTGGKHFVVNTAVNGRGPLVPANRVKQGNEVLCNPPGRGLGPKPTTNTGFPRVDAFAWIGNPGRSGGACRPGAPPTGEFWLGLALSLIRNADFRVR